MPPASLSVAGLAKRYATLVLDDVHLDVWTGEVHALVGANGAGKSTLARIAAGLIRADSGRMQIAGQPYAPASKRAAEQQGVRIVQQELNLIDTLSVAENIFFGDLPNRLGFIDYDRLHEQARQRLATVGLDDLDPATPVSQLGVGRQQLVEIAAALSGTCRLLILDEPTSALTSPETDRLFEQLERLRCDGTAILYISHRMEEIRAIADRVTVLRDGRVEATQPTADLSLERIIELMVGRGVAAHVEPETRPLGDVALRVVGLCRGDAVQNVGFEVRRGEILGLAGLVGSGRTETLRAVFGADQPDAGRVTLGPDGPPVTFRHPWQAVQAGIGLVPEDRARHGLLLPQSVRVNTTLGRLDEVTEPWGWIRADTERRTSERVCHGLDVQKESIEQPVAELSGGNQQKVLMARWLLRDCDVMLFDEPTRGIDVAAKRTVYRVLAQWAARGKALVVVSSELRELMTICDRIAVLSAGRLVATFARAEWSETAIMNAAISGYLDESRHA